MHHRFSAIAVSVVLAVASCGTETRSPSSARETITITETPAPVADQPAGPTALTPVTGSVVAAPTPVAATDGKMHLAYELILTNTLSQEVTLMSLGAIAGDKPLLTLTGPGLASRTRLVGNPAPTTAIGPAQTALVWLDVTVDDAAGVPTDLRHVVGISVPQPQPPIIDAAMTETIAPVKVDNRKPVTISPPLHGDDWVAGDGCCGMSGHRMAANPVNGAFWFAERFAIDYVRLTADARMFTGERTDLASYPYYGADVVAVADGPVVAVVDGLPEQAPGANPQGLQLDQYAGNRVIQDIGGGNYAMYAHLKTATVKPKVGDKLTTGQTLGSLGNSGNSDAPHLHFQLMSAADPLRSNGLPFVLDKFRLDGRLTSVDTLAATGGPAEFQHGVTAQDETYRMPLVLDVMNYPA
jgi:hypothetical protein